ncbi:MAG: oxidoreductase [Flavobacteriales bacterium]|jgi:NAD(P)-dependent dehydrogenase (short-subunit alcohol dehydrogenase family)
MNKKVILVTGASSGIGKATALRLLADGHIVYGTARRVAEMNDIVAAGGHAMRMDVTSGEEVRDCVSHLIQAEGRIDVLINNAGYAIYGAVEDTTIDDARRQYEVNLFGLARVTQAVLPHMRGKRSGAIINISSMGGKIHTPLGAWYHSTKFALEGWSDCLRLELRGTGVQVVIIEPGLIKTEFEDVMIGPFMARSGNGAYAELAQKMKRASHRNYDKNNASGPEVVAATISKAVRSARPRTRYATGKFAKLFLFFRWLVSDRLFDTVVMSQVK